ncbi:MAG: polyphosphate glucokinase [Verrucomicrobiales bacterium]|jgi:polyphosphate glucokinase
MKAAEVDIATGEIVSDKFRIPTPKPATPEAMADVVRQLTEHFEWTGPVGVGFPGVIDAGVVRTAANLDKSWLDVDGDSVFTTAAGCDVAMINDADAAGLAESRFGAAAGVSGVVILLTLGTGIGSAVLVDGVLVPNTEFGHLVLGGKIAEERASSRAKEEQDLSFKQWSKQLEMVLQELEKLFWPKLFILGGGISKDFRKFAKYLDDVQTPIVSAQQLNRAGIVGAALAQSHLEN